MLCLLTVGAPQLSICRQLAEWRRQSSGSVHYNRHVTQERHRGKLELHGMRHFHWKQTDLSSRKPGNPKISAVGEMLDKCRGGEECCLRKLVKSVFVCVRIDWCAGLLLSAECHVCHLLNHR